MTRYRTRVEGKFLRFTLYHGISAEAASDALHKWCPVRGQTAVWEVEERHGWRTMVEINGGELAPCPRCDGDGECWMCHGRGVV